MNLPCSVFFATQVADPGILSLDSSLAFKRHFELIGREYIYLAAENRSNR